MTKALGGEASWNMRNVAVDAFGSALGNSIVKEMKAYEQAKVDAAIDEVDVEMNRMFANVDDNVLINGVDQSPSYEDAFGRYLANKTYNSAGVEGSKKMNKQSAIDLQGIEDSIEGILNFTQNATHDATVRRLSNQQNELYSQQMSMELEMARTDDYVDLMYETWTNRWDDNRRAFRKETAAFERGLNKGSSTFNGDPSTWTAQQQLGLTHGGMLSDDFAMATRQGIAIAGDIAMYATMFTGAGLLTRGVMSGMKALGVYGGVRTGMFVGGSANLAASYVLDTDGDFTWKEGAMAFGTGAFGGGIAAKIGGVGGSALGSLGGELTNQVIGKLVSNQSLDVTKLVLATGFGALGQYGADQILGRLGGSLAQYSQPLMAGLASAKGFLPDVGAKWVSSLTNKGVSEGLEDVLKGGVNTSVGTTGNIGSGLTETALNTTDARLHVQFELQQQMQQQLQQLNQYEPYESDWENRVYHTRVGLLGSRRTSKDD